jgi:hypothetical protein
MTGSGVQQTRNGCAGVNRRGGEKPRGRNVRGAWQRLAEGRVFGLVWEWTARMESVERHKRRTNGGGAISVVPGPEKI